MRRRKKERKKEEHTHLHVASAQPLSHTHAGVSPIPMVVKMVRHTPCPLQSPPPSLSPPTLPFPSGATQTGTSHAAPRQLALSHVQTPFAVSQLPCALHPLGHTAKAHATPRHGSSHLHTRRNARSSSLSCQTFALLCCIAIAVSGTCAAAAASPPPSSTAFAAAALIRASSSRSALASRVARRWFTTPSAVSPRFLRAATPPRSPPPTSTASSMRNTESRGRGGVTHLPWPEHGRYSALVAPPPPPPALAADGGTRTFGQSRCVQLRPVHPSAQMQSPCAVQTPRSEQPLGQRRSSQRVPPHPAGQ